MSEVKWLQIVSHEILYYAMFIFWWRICILFSRALSIFSSHCLLLVSLYFCSSCLTFLTLSLTCLLSTFARSLILCMRSFLRIVQLAPFLSTTTLSLVLAWSCSLRIVLNWDSIKVCLRFSLSLRWLSILSLLAMARVWLELMRSALFKLWSLSASSFSNLNSSALLRVLTLLMRKLSLLFLSLLLPCK